jgi:hypothetical protein
VVGVGVALIVLCGLGAAVSGLWGSLGDDADEPVTDVGPVASVAGPSVAGPTTTFGDGQWLVGPDIVAGAYTATVPADSPTCSWERRTSSDGTVSAVLEYGGGRAGEKIVVDIRPTDRVFRSLGCGSWQPAP